MKIKLFALVVIVALAALAVFYDSFLEPDFYRPSDVAEVLSQKKAELVPEIDVCRV